MKGSIIHSQLTHVMNSCMYFQYKGQYIICGANWGVSMRFLEMQILRYFCGLWTCRCFKVSKWIWGDNHMFCSFPWSCTKLVMLYFYVTSVTNISWHVCAIQGSSKVLIDDFNNKINVPIEIVTSLAIIVVYLAIIKKFVNVFSLCLTEANTFIACK